MSDWHVLARHHSGEIPIQCAITKRWLFIELTAVHQFRAQLPVTGSLGRFVMNRAIAEDADIGDVIEVRDATRFGDGLLGLVRQAVKASGQGGEKIALDVGA